MKETKPRCYLKFQAQSQKNEQFFEKNKQSLLIMRTKYLEKVLPNMILYYHLKTFFFHKQTKRDCASM